MIDTTDIGLRLKAMEYWRCAEVGVTTPQTSEGVNSIKFVIAEALPDQGNVPNFRIHFLITSNANSKKIS